MATHNYKILKYPRTPHLQGSRLGEGDEDLSQIPFENIFNKNIVIEEKIDGANCAISFDTDNSLLLQSRGHYLDGGYKERHYNLFKSWAYSNREVLFTVLGTRYVMYGEWMYAKHTVFYDLLPDYFMEFDIYDRENDIFLDTDSRRDLTEKMEIIHSVPVLARGKFKTKKDILSYLGTSNYISENHTEVLRQLLIAEGLDVEEFIKRTDPTRTMEGLYIKVEENGAVKERVKYVRQSFIQRALSTTARWHAQPIVTNLTVEKS